MEQGKITQAVADKTDCRIYQQLNIAEIEKYINSKSQAPTSIKNFRHVEGQENEFFKSDNQVTHFVSLTQIARQYNEDTPSYIIQSWMRSQKTIEFLNLWEKKNNPNYNLQGYKILQDKLKSSSFTLTPKQWIEQTGAIGIISKQGKSGGTYAHLMIACEFLTWLSPEHKMLMIEMSQFRDEILGRSQEDSHM